MSIESRIAEIECIRGANDQQVAEHGRLLMMRDERNAGRAVEVLDDGFVHLVDHMGGDHAIVQSARVSYGDGTKSVSDDRSLIRYLVQHKHTTPLEMCEMKFHVRVPMDTWRQWIRHRTASVNEYSTRYSVAIDSMQNTEQDWRLQADTNKQGSMPGELMWPEGYKVEPPNDGSSGAVVLDNGRPRMLTSGDTMTPNEYLSAREVIFQKEARHVYEERLKFGVAREQARKDLPLSTYTEAYWKIDLHNLLHFLELRMEKHAQFEIRLYANAIAQLIKPIVPVTWEAFEDYCLNAMTLSIAEQNEIRQALHPTWTVCKKAMSSRERTELETKMECLGIEPLLYPSDEGLSS
jgi:thymidylate synthase (FAD)